MAFRAALALAVLGMVSGMSGVRMGKEVTPSSLTSETRRSSRWERMVGDAQQ